MNYNDIVSSNLKALGYEGSYNDMLYAYLVNRIGSRKQLNDMLKSFALSKGVSFQEVVSNLKDYILAIQYNFDGIDDRVQLDNIPLFVGDVVEFDFRGSIGSATRYLLDIGTPRTYALISAGNNILFSDTTINCEIDGTPILSGTTAVPYLDGELHKIRLTAIAPAAVSVVGCRFNLVDFYDDVIKNVRITRANPTDQYPDLFWPMDDGWESNPLIRQTIPHSHSITGVESYDSDGAVWVNYEKPEYHFDGVDDYLQLPTIPLFAGDAVSLDIKVSIASGARVLISDAGDTNHLFITNTGAIQSDIPGGYNLFINNIPASFGDVVSTGSLVKLTLERTGIDTSISRIAARLAGDLNYGDVIKNLRVTRTAPTDQYPNLFYPIDDGFDNNPIVSQVLSSSANWDGTAVNFNTENWKEPAPQYEGITGYETLSQRAVLSGLSEHDEAIASCREGLVRNGDFRFGNDNSFDVSFTGDVIDTYSITTDGLEVVTPVGSTTYYRKNGVPLVSGETYTLNVTTEYIRDEILRVLFDSAGSKTILTMPEHEGLQTHSVTFSHVDATVDLIELAFSFNQAGSFLVKEISIRKATDQQVLTPYVNNGEAVNFNEENWVNV